MFICAYDGDEAIEKVEEVTARPYAFRYYATGNETVWRYVVKYVKAMICQLLCLQQKTLKLIKYLGLELGADDYVTKPFSTTGAYLLV